MSEFCVKCCEKEAEIDVLRNKLYEALQQNEKLRNENDALIMDVAFYGGGLTNLSCNNK
jgi:hypothetical protein